MKTDLYYCDCDKWGNGLSATIGYCPHCNQPLKIKPDPIKDAIKEIWPSATIIEYQPLGDPIYQNWLNHPPNFYCINYSNAKVPTDEGFQYCTHQCLTCEHSRKIKT